jgi:hypothetical protein
MQLSNASDTEPSLAAKPVLGLELNKGITEVGKGTMQSGDDKV